MEIAVTSQNSRSVTSHAGKSRRFLVLDISCPCTPCEIERIDLPKEMSFHGFRGDRHPIDGISALITGGAGAGFRRRMTQRSIGHADLSAARCHKGLECEQGDYGAERCQHQP